MAVTAGRELRIPLRVKPEQKALIERAAEARGLTVTDFVLSLALREAEIAVTERRLFTLDPDAYDHFLAVLERPARVVPEIAHRLEKIRKSKWKVVR